MQIEAMEARMKEMGWTPHPNRYRDAVPIALGVAAGTTSGMSFGLINVEKNAKRTKDYVKKRDLFRTKEVAETGDTNAEAEDTDAEIEEAATVEEVEVAESSTEHTQVVETTTEHVVVVEHNIARKPTPARAATKIEAESMSHPEGLDTVVSTTTIAEATSVLSAEPIATETHTPSADAYPPTEQKMTKKDTLFSQVSVMNKKMRSFNFKKDKEEKKETTTVTVTEIACDVQSPVVNVDAVVSHDVVRKLDSPPMYTSEAKECVV